MVRILADTSTLYSTTQAEQAGFHVSPLSVTIAGNSYREFDEISAEEFVAIIRQGHMPTSSQPAIGAVADLYARFCEDEILNIAMAHGLSGTYSNAVSAAQMSEDPDRITVLNTRTLCGPHRYLTEIAVKMAAAGASRQEIVAHLEELMDTAKSYLIPDDFDYLRRGGRLSPLVSHVGKAAGLTPIMTQTDNGERLTVASIRRGFEHALKYLTKELEKAGVGKGWMVYITHADAPEKARRAREVLETAMPGAQYHIFPLSPAFITQGGPCCMAVQYIRAK